MTVSRVVGFSRWSIHTLVLISLVAGSLGTFLRSDIYYSRSSERILFYDTGVTFYACGQIQSGGLLYRDCAYPYGPLPMYLYVAVASLFGNSPATFYSYSLILNGLFLLLMYIAMSRAVGPYSAGCVTIFGIWLGVSYGTDAPYHPIERLLIGSAMLIWKPPSLRTWRTAAGIGACLGLWQWSKFGGAIYFAVALVAIDTSILLRSRLQNNMIRRWSQNTLIVIVVAAAIEGIRWAWAFAMLPTGIAWDFAWPRYVVEFYELFTQDGGRFPPWLGVKVFVAQQLVPVTGLVSTVFALLYFLSRRCMQDVDFQSEVSLCIPALFYLVGIDSYIGYDYAYYGFAWCLMPPCATVLRRAPKIAIPALLLAWAPHDFMVVRDALCSKTTATTHLDRIMQDGTICRLPPLIAQSHDALLDAFRATTIEGRIGVGPILAPCCCGFCYMHSLPMAGRITWCIPSYVRPVDQDALSNDVDRIPFVAYTYVYPIPSDATFESLFRHTLGVELTNKLEGRIESEVRVNAFTRIYHLKSKSG